MKINIQAILLSISLFFVGVDIAAQQAGPSMQAPKAGAMPQGPMPSVGDIFGNMSQDEIIQQVQEAQKFFDSLTPEEMAEVEKMVAETLKTMSDQDLQDIQQIATMVEPHLETPKKAEEPTEQIEKAKTSPNKEQAPTEVTDIDTKNIQQLITDLNKQISDIIQKAESSKELAEEINNKWSSKVTFDNMKKQIVSLKEDRLAKKLSKKDNPEDKDLVEALEKFHKDSTKHNKIFKVEDTFGIPESRKIEQQQLTQLKDTLSMFDNHIDKIMPLNEKFLRKHDPEALELAKEAETRAKKALEHAKDAEVRRGSLPAQPSESMKGAPAYQQQYPTGSHYRQGVYGTTNHPDYRSTQSHAKRDELTPAKGSSTPSGPTKTNSKQEDIAISPYQKIGNSLSSHLKEFDSEHEQGFTNFLKTKLSTYPSAQDSETVKKHANDFAQELKEFKHTSGDILGNIDKMTSESELQKLLENKELKKIDLRLKNYRNAQIQSQNKLNQTKETLSDNDPKSAQLKQQYHDFDHFMQTTIEAPLFDAEEAINSIENKTKRKKRLLKTSK